MVDMKTLLPELRKLVLALGEDLLARATSDKQIDAGLREAFSQIEKGGRTAQAFEVWRDDYLDQVAVAWVLACVFVRFMEDNHLIDECWLAGEGDRRKLAEDSHELFFREHPHDTDREYIQHVFHEVGRIPAAKDLFVEGKTPLWAVAPSGDAAMKLLTFWREIDGETGHLKRSFEVESGDTRLLGDLYQDLSQRAKDKFALLQTPVFVEKFILDRTLTPALAEFGLEQVRMIDPTCGSGHFLLGGFARLFREWCKLESNEIKAAQKALDGVCGVDINPFAVAIARFRLIVAAVQACGITRLKKAPAWKVHLATGDSLLFGSRWKLDGTRREEVRYLDDSWAPDIYACEDKDALKEILGQQYHVVVGNPPYIRPDDPARNDAYRTRYDSTHGKYTLAVPFFERFFDLGLTQAKGSLSGFIGFITSGAFMKADFGTRLVTCYLPRIDLTHVIDTANVPLPGHGTNTIIVFGRNRTPSAASVRIVRGISGESPPAPDIANSKVWNTILAHLDVLGYEDSFISVVDESRELLCTHPWSITGGGTTELKAMIEAARHRTLEQVSTDIGIGFVTLDDEVFQIPLQCARRHRIPPSNASSIVRGEDFREWIRVERSAAVFPYRWHTESGRFVPHLDSPTHEFLWPFRTRLWNRVWFEQTQRQRGLEWWEYGHVSSEKAKAVGTIFWGEISTHNHFGIESSSDLGDRTAPMIKLRSGPEAYSAEDVVQFLNSSTACFWLKEVCRPKGGDHVGKEGARVRKQLWDERFAFASKKVRQFPLPQFVSCRFGALLADEARSLSSLLKTLEDKLNAFSAEELQDAEQKYQFGLAKMRVWQEECDWDVYRNYGMVEEAFTYPNEDVPAIYSGHRAFEVLMARDDSTSGVTSTWFTRHGATPTTQLPAQWPKPYRELVQRRIDEILKNKLIRTIEKPEYKRRWNVDSWNTIRDRILRNWLATRLESRLYWQEHLRTIASLTDTASADNEFLQVAGLFRGRPDFDILQLINELVSEEAVPFLPSLRYKESGQRKRALWERAWRSQRAEDNGETIENIEEPPEYEKKDFASDAVWNMRGKLDVPKERWISYPHCHTDSDQTLVVGWAGWNHLQQATALVGYYDARKREGWDAKRLTPLLAGLDQLLPWIHQWHPEIDPEFGETAGQSYETMLKQDAHELGLTLDDIRNWEPPTPPSGRGRKRK